MKVIAAVFVAPLLLLPVVAGSVAASVAVTPPAGDRHELFAWVPEGGYPNRFPFGQCTWWAARNHRVTWWGNAADWLCNARGQGVATSEAPSVGAIVVYRPGGLYSELGHVAIVVATSATSYTVSEMNAPRWGVISIRTLPWPDPAAAGFIPVDAPAHERRVSVAPTGAVTLSIRPFEDSPASASRAGFVAETLPDTLARSVWRLSESRPRPLASKRRERYAGLTARV